MTLQLVFWSVLAVVMLVIAPIAMIWSAVDHFRKPASERKGLGGISAGIGAALVELDRLLTRPSVEHQLEAEKRVLKREDDSGGDV
jgi:hypothetical protein